MNAPGTEPTPLRALCGCGEPLEIEMERDAGTCLDCQRAEAERKEKAS